LKLIECTVGPTVLDPDIASFRPAERLEPAHKRCIPGLASGVAFGKGMQYANEWRALALLRPRRERPRSRAESRHEFAPFHQRALKSAGYPAFHNADDGLSTIIDVDVLDANILLIAVTQPSKHLNLHHVRSEQTTRSRC